MFWADKAAEEIIERYKKEIDSGEDIIVRDEKTASGHVHVGSLRGLVIHGVISKVLKEKGIKNKFLYEINDFDHMDGLPTYLDENEYKQHMGKPLNTIPSPDGKAKNFAEFYGNEFISVIEELGFNPTIYYPSELYKAGKFNEAIKLILDNADKIREIYKKVSGSEKDKDWYPLNIICEECGKTGTTKVYDWDGKEVSYKCSNKVDWAESCGHEGKISPYDGNASLPWKVEWPAKFDVLEVDVEGAGKDHSTAGGARQVSNAIYRQVFKKEPPYDIPYEFILIEGKKMSSSKGVGVTAREMADLLPPHILNLLLLYKKPNQTLEFAPEGESMPFLYDTYDRFAEKYFNDEEGYEKRVFELIHHEDNKWMLNKRVLPRFSQIAFLVQMPHINLQDEIEKSYGKLDANSKKELEIRAEYAKKWIDTYAPEKYLFKLADKLPDEAKNFSDKQKEAIGKVLEFLQNNEGKGGDIIHEQLHEIKKEVDIDPKDFFRAIYISILGKESGPKAGWFLSVLDRETLMRRFEEVVK